MNFLIPLFYTLIFCWIIYRSDFFVSSGINIWIRILIFLLKISTGVFVIFVYTHHYSNEKTSDVLHYYKDGEIIANTLQNNPADFIKLMSGIGCDTEYFYTNYFSKMSKWQKYHESLFFNDCHTIIRFNAIIQIISFKVLHAGTVMACFLSYFGLTALYKAFVRFVPEKKTLLIPAIFLGPSVLFWCSSLFKESLLIFGFGLLINSLFCILFEKKSNWKIFLMLVIGLFISITVKIYILLLFLPPLFTFVLISKSTIGQKFVVYLSVNLLSFVVALLFSNLILNRNFVKEIIRHQHDFINIAQGGVYLYKDSVAIRLSYLDRHRIIPTNKKDTVRILHGSSYQKWNNVTESDTVTILNSTDTSEYWNAASIEPARSSYFMPHLKYSFSSFVFYTPQALSNVLLRPFIWEAENLYQTLCSIENLIYVMVFILCLIFSDYKKGNKNVFWLGVFFCLNLFLIIGFTTPVAGALVRYKVPAIPFFLLSAISIIDVDKAKKIPVLSWFLRT